MAYLDGLLADGEVVLVKAHRHIIFLIMHILPFALLTIALWVAAGFVWAKVDTATTVLTLILLVLSLVPLARAIQTFLVWVREEYILTNYRILQVEGLLNKRTLDSSLEKVNDVLTTQPILGRIFNYGTIEIITGSDKGVNNLAGIADPLPFKRALIDAKKAIERGDGIDDGRAPQPRSVRYADPRQGDDTMDAARLLAALTELRDSGVITVDEYETRKQELLRR